MRKIDLWKVFCGVIKRLWLPVLLAAVGVVVTLGTIRSVPAEWAFRAVYLVEMQQPDERAADFETYQFEIQLANTISQVLSTDPKVEGVEDFTVTSSNRRVYATATDQSKEHLQLVADQVEAGARECLQTEVGASAVLKTEQYTISEQESSASRQMKIVILGGLVGLCSGLAVLLLIEYAKSPAVRQNPDQRGSQS